MLNFFGREELDAAYRHLRANELEVYETKIAPYGMKQLWITDPVGYGLCFSMARHSADLRSVGHRRWLESRENGLATGPSPVRECGAGAPALAGQPSAA
jgi:hypothetical protein